MKIALCLSGHSRTIDTRGINIDYRPSINLINKNIIGNNDVDVFLHTWNNNKSIEFIENLNNDLKNDFNPKSIVIEDSIFPNYIIGNNINTNINFPNRHYDLKTQTQAIYSRWDSLQKVNKLRKQYQEKNHIKYDFIVFSRYDLYWYDRIPFEFMNKNEFYVPNWHYFWNELNEIFFGYNDVYFISGEKNANIYAKIFSDLDKTLEDAGKFENYCKKMWNDASLKFSNHAISRWQMIENNLLENERFYGLEYETWNLIRKGNSIRKNMHGIFPRAKNNNILDPRDYIKQINGKFK